ncbi:MAG TPA: hypothetical protein VHG08_03225 [Longimicrobium sp.]|nr:hypothetical protein [Longimicrobium sp.]
MKRKTPQEKKRESYLHDRRNTYGENSKSSRRNIARNKRLRSRLERRLARTAFVPGAGLDVERMDDVESRVVRQRRRAWTKCPDEPLEKVVKEKLARRVELGMLGAAEAAARLARIRAATRRDG